MNTQTDTKYGITEGGKNGSITVTEKGLDRVIKRTFGKDDRQFFPFRSISSVHHDRKRLGRDTVTVHVGTHSYEWKIQLDAEGFVNTLNERIS